MQTATITHARGRTHVHLSAAESVATATRRIARICARLSDPSATVEWAGRTYVLEGNRLRPTNGRGRDLHL